MRLIRTAFFTSLATAIRILSGLVVVKAIAVYVGPDGLGKMGQFMSLMTIMGTLAGGGIGNGVIKYVAEYRGNEQQLLQLLGNGTAYTLFCSSFIAILGVLFRHELALSLLGSEQYVSIIVVLACGQFLIAFNSFLVAMVNGFKDVTRLTRLNIIGTLVGVVILVCLIQHAQLYGGLLGLVLMQVVLVFVSITYVWRADWFKKVYLKLSINKPILLNLAKFSLMTIVSAIATPLAQIIIRGYVQHVLSWHEVGYWQAITRISDTYLLFVTTTLTVYYLPRLSEITDKIELKNEIKKTYAVILPAVIGAALAIYLLRDVIIWLLFTPDFKEVRGLFAFQLLGDVIKMAAWLLAFLMLAKAMTKTYIVTEIFFNATLVVFSYAFVHYFGLVGLTYAFALNYLLYYVTMYFMFKCYCLGWFDGVADEKLSIGINSGTSL